MYNATYENYTVLYVIKPLCNSCLSANNEIKTMKLYLNKQVTNHYQVAYKNGSVKIISDY